MDVQSWPAGTWQPWDRGSGGGAPGEKLGRGGGRRGERGHHDGWGGERHSRGIEADQRARGWSRDESRGGVRQYRESSFGEEQWYDDRGLGEDFADVGHQPSFNVADEKGYRSSPQQVADAHTSSTHERTGNEGDRYGSSHGSWTDSAGSSWQGHNDHDSDGCDGSWHNSFDGPWCGSVRSEYPVQDEEGIVRGCMEGVLERLIGSSTAQGAHTSRRWKSEMFVMLPESNILKCVRVRVLFLVHVCVI